MNIILRKRFLLFTSADRKIRRKGIQQTQGQQH